MSGVPIPAGGSSLPASSAKRLKILLVEDEADIRDLLSFQIESSTGALVYEAEGVEQARLVLEQHPDIAMVVSDYVLKQGTGLDVFHHLENITKKRGVTIPFILCSSVNIETIEGFRGKKLEAVIEKPDIRVPLEQALVAWMERTHPVGAFDHALQPYVKVRISLLSRIGREGHLPCDVYEIGFDGAHRKIMDAGKSLTAADVEGFRLRGIQHLYLSRQESAIFLEYLGQLLEVTQSQLRVHRADAVTANTLITQAQETIQDLSLVLGFTPEIQQITKLNVQLALEVIKETPELWDFFEKILVDEESYGASHVVAIAHVACGLATQMQMGLESTHFKLTLAAFLHDITLENPKLAPLRTLEEVKQLQAKGELSEEDLRNFAEHPIRASQIAEKFAELPMDVDKIVAQHHEQPDGSGFPHGITHTRFTPLAAVFNVAHDIVSFLHTAKAGGASQSRVSLKDFLMLNDQKYSQGYFKRVMASIRASGEKKGF